MRVRGMALDIHGKGEVSQVKPFMSCVYCRGAVGLPGLPLLPTDKDRQNTMPLVKLPESGAAFSVAQLLQQNLFRIGGDDLRSKVFHCIDLSRDTAVTQARA